MKTVLINISNKEVRFNKRLKISIHKTNLPIEFLQFRSQLEIFWKLQMISFKKEEGILRVKVLDYFSHDYTSFDSQSQKYPIRYIKFETLDWKKLEPLLSTYHKKHLSDYIDEEATGLHQVSIPIRVPISKLTFHLGYVSFHRSFPWRKGNTEFRISHPDSIQEYEYIKYYFANILDKGTIDVYIDVESTSSETKVTNIRSTELGKINNQNVRLLKIRKIEEWSTKKPKIDQPDKKLFTFQEAMDSYGDEQLGNVDDLEKELLYHLLEKEDIRNKMQLRYLSERIQNENQPLLMTLVPQFGFVFVNDGAEMVHFIWELINSHATYVWSIPPDTSTDMVHAIEQEIQSVAALGRQMYRSKFETREDLFYHPISHQSKSYSYEQSFAKWKKNLDILLI